MKRFDFLKRLGLVSAASVISPRIKSEGNPAYSFDEVFEIWKGNDSLVYPRKSPLYNAIKEQVGLHRIIDEKYFTHYVPFRSCYLPVKKTYIMDDFSPFILLLNSLYEKDESYSEYSNGVFFRLIKESPDAMVFEAFSGNINGQYGSFVQGRIAGRPVKIQQ